MAHMHKHVEHECNGMYAQAQDFRNDACCCNVQTQQYSLHTRTLSFDNVLAACILEAFLLTIY